MKNFRFRDIGSGKNLGRFLKNAGLAGPDQPYDSSLQHRSKFQGDSGTGDVETSPTMPMPTGEGMKIDGTAAKSVMEGGPPGFAGGNMAGLFGGLSKRDTQVGGLKEILGGIGSDMSKWTPDQIGGLQKGLSDIGAYDGEIDGILGPKTTKGLRQYQGEQAEVMKRQNDPGAEFSAFPQGLLPEGFEDPGFKDTAESGREFANFPLGLLDGATGGHLNLENNQPMENPGRPNVPMEGFQPDTLDDAVVGPDPQLQEFSPWERPAPMGKSNPPPDDPYDISGWGQVSGKDGEPPSFYGPSGEVTQDQFNQQVNNSRRANLMRKMGISDRAIKSTLERSSSDPKDLYEQMLSMNPEMREAKTERDTMMDDGTLHKVMSIPTKEGLRYYGGSFKTKNPPGRRGLFGSRTSQQLARLRALQNYQSAPADSIPQAQLDSNWWE